MRRRPWLSGAVTTAAVLAVLVTVPAADRVTVTEVPCDPTGAALRVAVNAARSGDTLVLAAGCVYSIAAPDHNRDTALPVIAKTLTILGNGATVQRDPAARAHFRIFKVVAPGDLRLDSLTVRYGHAPNAGGAVLLGGGRLTLSHSAIVDNTADLVGGGINEANGILTATDSVLSHNTAAAGSGGMLMDGGSATFTRSRIDGNSAGGVGGGIGGVGVAPKLTLTHSWVTGNIAEFGAGLMNDGTATLDHTTVSGNTATGVNARGGGIENDGTLALDNSTVTGNRVIGANPRGGGLFNVGDATLTDSPVTGNHAEGSGEQGGGIFGHVPPGTVRIIGHTVADNSPDQCGTPSTVPGC
ncbi:hypothetical protein [Gandjariella thermophila]|uniref:Right handed beta helix domain-containing protein n=1 Tax=Gandjariella thermophila TaxID=1931992 RepID=A0A4D4J560_9PSEU|nr:hypothetical protein [Gandjariella thermophila]GDY29739.1 hypothetical protein GTS_13720 [Gandjariella thermophila]